MACVLGGFVALSACSNQGLGERCEVLNGNTDCNDGLVCLSATAQNAIYSTGVGLVNPPYNDSDRCCPFDRSTTDNPACSLVTTSVAGDSGTPPGDTGPANEASTVDAADADAADAADTSTSAPDAADAADGG